MYTCPNSLVTDQNISCDFQLSANKTGDTLLYAGVVINRSNDTLKINRSNLQIENSKGIRNDIIWCDAKTLTILPNSSDTIKFGFAPTNNPDLYERINYHGDMDSVYSVNVNFIQKANFQDLALQKQRFCLNKKSYSYYKENFGIEKRLKLFKVKNEVEGFKDDRAKASIVLPNKNKLEIENKVAVFNAIIKLNFYSIDSVLYLQAKMINHSQAALKIDPTQFKINIDHQTIYPQFVSIGNSVCSKENFTLTLLGGNRIEFKLKYGHIKSNAFLMLDKTYIYLRQ